MKKNCSMMVLVLLVVCFVCFASSRAIALQKYTITDLGTLGGSESFAYAINDNGHIVGEARLPGDTDSHAFLYAKGVMRDIYPINSQEIRTVGPTGINNAGQIVSGLVVSGIYYPAIYDSKTGAITVLGSLGGVNSSGWSGVATSINKSGQAVGYSNFDSINYHAFIYSGGTMMDLGSFGGLSGAVAINDFGVVVGGSSYADYGFGHAALWANGVISDISGGRESWANSINNKGEVVGHFIASDGTGHAFLYRDGVNYDLGNLGGLDAEPNSINERGQIVGEAYVQVGTEPCLDPGTGRIECPIFGYHAFLDENGVMTDLNDLIPSNSGWDLQFGSDINNSGQIVGYGLYGGNYRAYMLTPVPEPVTIDIRPWSKRNPINYKGHGVLRVAILSTEDFDAPRQVDQHSLTFGATGDEKSLAFCNRRPRDVSRDGARDDLVCHFYVVIAGFKCGDTEGILNGKTLSGTPIEGEDLVRIINCK